ncbi:MAG TPA: radical SAM protein, partial [Gemmatimonadales bacterium]|nr:radical SAM protein [Gemmatimonadales bacterium]
TLARGASRSRDPEDIVREAALLARSHAEIVLTGVHIGSYGADLPARTTLGHLAELLIERVSTVRFRLSSLEATELDERLERLMAAEPQRLAPHLHAPLQSGSDRLLRRMGRRWYTAESYRRRIERLAERVQPLGLGADVIVGFPGETESDHRATVALVEALPFSYLHVFPWSARTGTAAARLSGAPGSAVVRERCEELRSLASRKREAHRLARAGGRADLVLEARSGGWRQGLSEDYLSVSVPADAPWAMGCARTSVRLTLTAGRLTGAAA